MSAPPPVEISTESANMLHQGIADVRAGRVAKLTTAGKRSAADEAGIFAEPERSFPPPPVMRDGFARIVHAIYDEGVDVEAEYQAIARFLSMDDAMTPGSIRVQAARAEDMARRAYRLYLLARYEYEGFLRQSDVCWGAIRDAARRRLEGDKKVGARTKQVTDADVLAEAAIAFPDEWDDISDHREKARGMRDMIEQLATLAEKRVFSLGRLLEPGTGRV